MDYDFDIAHDEIRKVNYPEIAFSGQLGPCIAMGIYDKISRSGYICKGCITDFDLIKETINLALSNFKDKNSLKIGVAGANKSFVKDEEDPEDKICDYTWNELEEIIGSYNFNKGNVMLHRSVQKGMNQDLYLDCKNGKVVVKTFAEKLPGEYNG